MNIANINALADELFTAEQLCKAVPKLTDRFPEMTVQDAYAVQLVNIERVVQMGYKISGKKIGLTSDGMQKQLGVGEPDYGHLFDAMECKNGQIVTSGLILPKIEGELAFVLKKDISGGRATVEDVINATDYVVAAFEIVDSRVADWKIALPDTVADNASSGRYILGAKHIKPEDIDLAAVSMRLYKNEALIGEGLGAAVLGNPAAAVAWLANCLWGYGVTLNAGEVVLSGAFSAAPAAVRGDVFEAEFSDFGRLKAIFI